jgi:hypothetical protein
LTLLFRHARNNIHAPMKLQGSGVATNPWRFGAQFDLIKCISAYNTDS